MFGGGGDALPDELIHTFRTLAAKPGRFGRTKRPRFVRGYGLAETAGQLATALGPPCGDGAAGKIMRGVQYKIVDADGRAVPKGEVGELVVKTPGIMSGYWNNPEETAKVLRDGWFHTGDLVREGRRRMLYMQAREKDMIKVGGYSVFPAEVERKLAEHPAVLQVAVVGVPHGVKGEMPVAAVVRQPGSKVSEDELRRVGQGTHRPVQGAAPRRLRRRHPAELRHEGEAPRGARAGDGAAGGREPPD